ncbi:MAG: hypothetical protein K5888_07255 [Lachnospiraceae bacterium]|nr:hypothetical protein [Lachnospiraceae bacterium]
MGKRKYNDDDFNNEHHAFSFPVMVTTAIVSGVILVILLVVLATNKTNSGRYNRKNTQLLNQMQATPESGAVTEAYDNGEKDIEKLYEEGKLRAEDLDIWDMYSDDPNGGIPNPDASENTPEPSATPGEEEASPSPSHSPGSILEGYELVDGINTNTVDFKALKLVDNKMSYSVNGRKVSQLGAMISADNGNIDFYTLKSNGVSFVMIKVGSRGYDSGIINEDVNFEQNIKGATEAGLGIGLYFESRAVNVREAIEEADFVASRAYDYRITYPVAYVFGGKIFDSTRTDSLSEKQLTEIADTFLAQVKLNGYTPILYGTGKFLLYDIDEKTLLRLYDVFLSDDDPVSEFPYQFKLWRYTSDVSIKGMEKPGDYVMSLVDYAGR